MDIADLEIEEIEDRIACLTEFQTTLSTEEYTFEDTRLNNAVDSAINALKKHIPMKVILDDCVSMSKFVACPTCHNFFGYQYSLDSRPKLSYCDSCGQAIDWDVEFYTWE